MLRSDGNDPGFSVAAAAADALMTDDPPSSAGATERLADEDAGFVDAPFDLEDWPAPFGAARLGIP
jgi:hypothetical protein